MLLKTLPEKNTHRLADWNGTLALLLFDGASPVLCRRVRSGPWRGLVMSSWTFTRRLALSKQLMLKRNLRCISLKRASKRVQGIASMLTQLRLSPAQQAEQLPQMHLCTWPMCMRRQEAGCAKLIWGLMHPMAWKTSRLAVSVAMTLPAIARVIC